MEKENAVKNGLFTLGIFVLLLVVVVGLIKYGGKIFHSVQSGKESIAEMLELDTGTRMIEVDSGTADYLQKVYAQIDEAICNEETQICIVDQTELEWDSFIAYEGYPYFWLENSTVSRVRKTQDDVTKTYDIYTFTYQDDIDERTEMQQKINQATQQILSQIPTDADQWEACKAIHDALCKRVSYDESKISQHGHDIYGALVEGTAVCQGYTYSFAYLLKQWGLNAAEVGNETHDWNELYILSYAAFVDITWDDLDEEDSYGRPYICYDYFGITKEEANRVESHQTADDTGRTNLEISADSEVVFNYHEHEGCYFTAYSYDNIKNTFYRQLRTGVNMLTVKFANEEAYQQAKIQLLGNDGEGLAKLLGEIGYTGRYRYWQQDDLYILDIGLYAKSEA